MDTLRVLFLRQRSVASVAIRAATWSTWSHCGIVTPELTVIEAKGLHGVREVPLEEAIAGASRWQMVGVACPLPELAIAWARSQIGRPYDWTGVIGLGLHREWDDPAAWWCSELVEAALAKGGRRRFRPDMRRITPQHCWMVL